jgi:type II secretory pathway component PulF
MTNVLIGRDIHRREGLVKADTEREAIHEKRKEGIEIIQLQATRKQGVWLTPRS